MSTETKIYYVNSDPKVGNDLNDGLTPNTPFRTLAQAASKTDASTIDIGSVNYEPKKLRKLKRMARSRSMLTKKHLKATRKEWASKTGWRFVYNPIQLMSFQASNPHRGAMVIRIIKHNFRTTKPYVKYLFASK